VVPKNNNLEGKKKERGISFLVWSRYEITFSIIITLENRHVFFPGGRHRRKGVADKNPGGKQGQKEKSFSTC